MLIQHVKPYNSNPCGRLEGVTHGELARELHMEDIEVNTDGTFLFIVNSQLCKLAPAAPGQWLAYGPEHLIAMLFARTFIPGRSPNSNSAIEHRV